MWIYRKDFGSAIQDVSNLQGTIVVVHALRHYILHIGVTGVCSPSPLVRAFCTNVMDTGLTLVKLTHI